MIKCTCICESEIRGHGQQFGQGIFGHFGHGFGYACPPISDANEVLQVKPKRLDCISNSPFCSRKSDDLLVRTEVPSTKLEPLKIAQERIAAE